MSINKFIIYGERCSGTNYIEELITLNFNVELTWDYGFKHFFGFNDDLLIDSDDTLFICIIRDPVTWINSFFREKHHLQQKYIEYPNKDAEINAFLNDEIYSVNENENNDEILTDRHIYTRKRYKNIFELRYTKTKYMLYDLPKKVKNHIFIKYEDLMNDFKNTMYKIKNKGLTIKQNLDYFPKNTDNYKQMSTISFKESRHEKINYITNEMIINNPNYNKNFEKIIGYKN